MEAVFTLPYPEYSTAIALHKEFKKKDGYSVQIPLSRQQKGIDLLLYSQRSKKSVTIQIKSSRVWVKDTSKIKRNLERIFQYNSWNNSFQYEKGLADYYLYFLLYPKGLAYGKKLNKEKSVGKWWDSCLIVFNDKEMGELLGKIQTKGGKKERFFGFGFDDKARDVHLCRGVIKPISYRQNIFKHKINEIKSVLN